MSKSLINEAVLTQVINTCATASSGVVPRWDCGRRSWPSSNSPPS